MNLPHRSVNSSKGQLPSSHSSRPILKEPTEAHNPTALHGNYDSHSSLGSSWSQVGPFRHVSREHSLSSRPIEQQEYCQDDFPDNLRITRDGHIMTPVQQSNSLSQLASIQSDMYIMRPLQPPSTMFSSNTRAVEAIEPCATYLQPQDYFRGIGSWQVSSRVIGGNTMSMSAAGRSSYRGDLLRSYPRVLIESSAALSRHDDSVNPPINYISSTSSRARYNAPSAGIYGSSAAMPWSYNDLSRTRPGQL